MEWNIYKDWLDPVLYRQMVSMIYQLSSNADKEAFLKQERETACFMESVSTAWRKNIIFTIPEKY